MVALRALRTLFSICTVLRDGAHLDMATANMGIDGSALSKEWVWDRAGRLGYRNFMIFCSGLLDVCTRRA